MTNVPPFPINAELRRRDLLNALESDAPRVSGREGMTPLKAALLTGALVIAGVVICATVVVVIGLSAVVMTPLGLIALVVTAVRKGWMRDE